MNLIYLHGFASGPKSTKAEFFLKQLLIQDKNVLIPDLNCPDFEHTTLSSQMELVENFLAPAQATVLIGSSMGGLLATLLAMKHEQIKALILLAPAFGIQSHLENIWSQSEFSQWQQRGYLEVYHHAFQREKRLSFNFWKDLQQHKTEQLRINVPALVFHGENDAVVAARVSRDFAVLNQQHVQLHIVIDDHQLIASLDKIWSNSKIFLDMIADC